VAGEQQASAAGQSTSRSSKAPSGLGRLARRISAWTTNSLITVMLLVVALGFGREVLHWWHGVPSSATAPIPSADCLSDGTAPHDLEFGNQPWSIRRQEFSGPLGDLPSALQSACRTAIVDCRPHGESADAAEQELLKRLAAERPVAQERGQWRLYRWGEGHPVLIGTRACDTATAVGKGGIAPITGTSLDKTAFRVVLWGIAVPEAAKAWNLYLFQSRGAAGEAGHGGSEIPLPPGGHRILSIRSSEGGAITAFTTNDSNVGREFYDRWFTDHGWTAAVRWRPVASGWHARFETQSRGLTVAADIRLGADAQGRWTGLVIEGQGSAMR